MNEATKNDYFFPEYSKIKWECWIRQAIIVWAKMSNKLFSNKIYFPIQKWTSTITISLVLHLKYKMTVMFKIVLFKGVVPTF